MVTHWDTFYHAVCSFCVLSYSLETRGKIGSTKARVLATLFPMPSSQHSSWTRSSVSKGEMHLRRKTREGLHKYLLKEGEDIPTGPYYPISSYYSFHESKGSGSNVECHLKLHRIFPGLLLETHTSHIWLWSTVASNSPPHCHCYTLRRLLLQYWQLSMHITAIFMGMQ